MHCTRAISRKDHISIDSFYVVDAKTKGFASNISKQKFQDRINNVFLKEEKLSVEIDALEAKSEIISEKIKGVLSPFSPSVDVYHELSLNRTIIEVEAVDKIGLLYKIAKTISEKNFDITFAKVSTEKGIAIDTFYIEHADLESDEPQKGLLELKDDIKKIID